VYFTNLRMMQKEMKKEFGKAVCEERFCVVYDELHIRLNGRMRVERAVARME